MYVYQIRDRNVCLVGSRFCRVLGKGTARPLNSNINPIVGKSDILRPRIISRLTNRMRLVGNADVIAIHP